MTITRDTHRSRPAHAGITYTIVDSDLGLLLVATSPDGIRAVRFGDEGSGLADSLVADFPGVDVRRDDDGLAATAALVLAAIGGGTREAGADVRLDVRGTPFQLQVWSVLRSIARGETRSYGEVARAMGSPTAVRAVARACGANPVAVLVPCHRVVGADGAMRGYRWGVHRKQALLDLERVASTAGSLCVSGAPGALSAQRT